MTNLTLEAGVHPARVLLRHHRPHCAECNEQLFRLGGVWRLPIYCRYGHPPRGSAVLPGVPRWMISVLNGEDAEALLGKHRRLPSAGATEVFLLNNEPSSIFLDHYGHDCKEDFICEPYDSPRTRAAVESFGEKLHLRYGVAYPSWRAPWDRHVIRVTFHQPLA